MNCYNRDMKKLLIALLVIVSVGAVVYLQFFRNAQPNASNGGGETTATSQAAATGATIDLSRKGLTTIPKDILNNATATTLDVSNNALTGALPGEIRLLSRLEVLTAANNMLTGIPAEIGQLRNLKIADFANNNISGLPREIGNLSNLHTLDLRGNPNISLQDLATIRQKIPNAQILTD